MLLKFKCHKDLRNWSLCESLLYTGEGFSLTEYKTCEWAHEHLPTSIISINDKFCKLLQLNLQDLQGVIIAVWTRSIHWKQEMRISFWLWDCCIIWNKCKAEAAQVSCLLFICTGLSGLRVWRQLNIISNQSNLSLSSTAAQLTESLQNYTHA